MTIEAHPLPEGALLDRYARMPGAYTDCFSCMVAGTITLETYLRAFYSTRLFGLERHVLRLAGSPSTREDIDALARGQTRNFAAWEVDSRTTQEVLLRDRSGRTRSWLGVAAENGGTRLFFGSAVPPDRSGKLGPGFQALLGVHKLYARALLNGARKRLSRQMP